MRRLFTFASLIVCLASISFGTQTPQKAQTPQKKSHARKKAQNAPVVTTDKLVEAMPQQPPAPPPTPEQGPSSPPEVSYQAGQLVIVARNSTMGDVLNAVKQKTGASVEMPPASTERVVGKFGPGAPRDVMAQLLNGSHYDYVLLGSPADPGALKKVVLMARVSGPQPNSPQQAQQQPPGFQNRANQSQNLQAVPEVENDQPAEDATPDTSQDVQPPEEEQPATDQPNADQPQPGQQPMVKTPEQLLRELQQQQQQQQQQDQNGQPAPPEQPPQ